MYRTKDATFCVALTEPIPQKRYLMDGVYLSETGVQHMQEITIQIPKVKRQRRNNKRLSVDMLPGQRLATQMSTEGDEEKGKKNEKLWNSSCIKNYSVVALCSWLSFHTYLIAFSFK